MTTTLDAAAPVRHGSTWAYRKNRCRCTDCSAAGSRASKHYRHRVYLEGGPLSVDATFAKRRIHALMRLGWPQRELSRLLGYRGDVVGQLIGGRHRDRIYLDKHRRICKLYEELCMTPGPSEASRRRATTKGWLPPLAWDDIDDPHEHPAATQDRDRDDVDEAVVLRILAYDVVPATAAERTEVVRRWRLTGKSLNELEDLTGWRTYRYYDPTKPLERQACRS